jgi:Rv2525c-like, glycoside hydrolase-like domain
LTADQGTIDGRDAADLAAADGFPSGTVVYLDWEYGSLDGDGSGDYIKAWVNAVVADGRTAPGIYCSHVIAQAIVAIVDSINPTPSTRLWCWRVPTAANHSFKGDLAQIPEIDPAGCGFAGAQVWQREQNAIVAFPEGAPVSSLTLDFSTSSLPDPGAADVTSHLMRVELEGAPAGGRARVVKKKRARVGKRMSGDRGKPEAGIARGKARGAVTKQRAGSKTKNTQKTEGVKKTKNSKRAKKTKKTKGKASK